MYGKASLTPALPKTAPAAPAAPATPAEPKPLVEGLHGGLVPDTTGPLVRCNAQC